MESGWHDGEAMGGMELRSVMYVGREALWI